MKAAEAEGTQARESAKKRRGKKNIDGHVTARAHARLQKTENEYRRDQP